VQGDYIDATSGSPARSAFAWFDVPSPLGTSPDCMVTTLAAPEQVATLRVRPGSVAVADFGCSQDDGMLVAGETANLTIPLQNFGRSSLTGIHGTVTGLTPGVTVYVTDNEVPGTFGFRLAGPNPFRERTTLHYALAKRTQVRLEVFGVTGERVRTLVNRVLEPGSYDAFLDARAVGQRPLGSGVYWARLTAGGEVRTLRVVALE
jgi:hypothetical protein